MAKGTEHRPLRSIALSLGMRLIWKRLVSVGIRLLILVPLLTWIIYYRRGKHFALRDRLRKADAIIVLAGTRGNLEFLHGKIRTAVALYQKEWAPCIIFVGKFSRMVTDTPTLIPLKELISAAAEGRIQEKDISVAAQTWDICLGAEYMRNQALQMGVPAEATLVEKESLHTRENAEYVLKLLQEHQMKTVILITTPFHQLRTYLTFAKVFQPHGIRILNYYADSGEWHPMLWFLSKENRNLVKSEIKRIKTYREKGDIL
jgi:uncharacterized SAM-binding protein YcdF (DUF218 family)